jgi:hypothetical protein
MPASSISVRAKAGARKPSQKRTFACVWEA